MTAGRDQGTFIVQYGTNAERLALDTNQIKPLTAWHETDTGNEYKWFGSWVAYPGAAGNGVNPAQPKPAASEGATYDTSGRLLTFARSINGVTYTTTFTYDTSGRFSSDTTAAG